MSSATPITRLSLSNKSLINALTSMWKFQVSECATNQVSGITSKLSVTQPVRKSHINQRRPLFNKVEKMLLMLGEH